MNPLDQQFHIAQHRKRRRFDRLAVGRFLPIRGTGQVIEPKSSLPDRWTFRDEQMERYSPKTNFQRLQEYLQKRHNLETSA